MVDDIFPHKSVDYIAPIGEGTSAARLTVLQDQAKDLDNQDDKSARTFKAKDGKTYLLDKVGLKNWSSKPAFPGQFSIEQARKIGPTTTAVFNLSTQLDEYNELLAKASYQGEFYDLDPAIIIVNMERQFWEGSFYVCVSYQPIYYAMQSKTY